MLRNIVQKTSKRCSLTHIPRCARPPSPTFRPDSGGLTVGAKADTLSHIASNSADLGNVTPEILQGRKYCVVRAIGDLPAGAAGAAKASTGKDQQKALLKEFYEAMDEWEA